MIIIRYLIRETLKSQVAILFVLLLIFFCQRLVEILGAAVEGNIPANLVISLLGLGVPEMAQLILPLSLFLGVLMTFSKLYTESEITVMHACGLGKRVLVVSALILALLTSALAAVNVIWMIPWSSKYQEQVLADAKANPSLAAIIEGKFKPSDNGNLVLYIGSVHGDKFKNVFLAQLRPVDNQRPSVVISDGGHMVERPDGRQEVILNHGMRYEGTAMLRDFRITEFNNYQAVVGHQVSAVDGDKVEQKSITQLWRDNDKDSRAEFHWRLTLVLSVLIMAMMVVPLSVVNPRQGRVLSMLPAMLLYLIFFLLQSSLRSNGSKGKLDPLIWMWVVNGAYLMLALVLNIWDTVPMRRIWSRLKGRGVA
ncbi:LPS export ABC transporter permease LptF [Photorhabdus heterorhabditis]|uniref:Lipopolysaccharide export system permease protein LptF n=1 Tax=Photorhabdus heterorhabditis TaxID=880156 RepID=A0A5B0WSE6_9GAMM|nr:LPS export ABC transporter permease LptF [Photorhabdus heterorhabditis]KAA1189843.1 LPS export ABC transporter permease LptF [Photorhabdus heterorhabditis]KOY62014.1 lipopolysaccharide ABC transporter permease [Photorhabdus heterorhabditis]MBS9442013.1 lipopolysaccharide ABC transporter permease LptF [Photorhabdus heterorhabditis]